MFETAMNDTGLINATSRVVAGYLSRNNLTQEDLPEFIEKVAAALATVGGMEAPKENMPPKALVPAVPIEESVTPDYIVCLEDGKRMKMLKRHLANEFNLSPAQYRAKWGLPDDYPMVAPNYSDLRRRLVSKTGSNIGRAFRTAA